MRRSIFDTYHYIKNKLGDPESLPIRKRFCLQYLKWGSTVKTTDRDEFVELAKEWRVTENRMGNHRTILEKKARKLFWKIAKKKKLAPSREGAKKWAEESQRKQIGVHSPEQKAKLVEHNRRNNQKMKEGGYGRSRVDWVITSPTGEVFHTNSMRQFCLEHGLHDSWMCRTSIYPGVTYRGWSARKVSSEFDNL